MPVVVRISETEFMTSLFPKGGRYLVPLKAAVRKSAGIDIHQVLTVMLAIRRQ